MQKLKDYRFLFPIHDIEFEWMEKGIEQGIEQGKAEGKAEGKVEGMLEQARQTLATLDPDAASSMADCREISTIKAAIDAAIQRLRTGLSHQA